MKYLFALLLLLPYAAWAQSPPPPPQAANRLSYGSYCAYPETARKAGVQGRTTVSFDVADDLTINNVSIAVSSGNSDLDAATIRCVANWRIPPAWTFMKASKGQGVTIGWVIPASGSEPAFGGILGRPHTCTENYPEAEAKAGIGGTTMLEFRITVDGTVASPRVLQSSGNDDLDQAALSCVAQWRYEPAMQNAKPIEVPWKAKVVWIAPPPAPAIPPKAYPEPPLAGRRT